MASVLFIAQMTRGDRLRYATALGTRKEGVGEPGAEHEPEWCHDQWEIEAAAAIIADQDFPCQQTKTRMACKVSLLIRAIFNISELRRKGLSMP